jgi:membrane-anchored mycosin MYCP
MPRRLTLAVAGLSLAVAGLVTGPGASPALASTRAAGKTAGRTAARTRGRPGGAGRKAGGGPLRPGPLPGPVQGCPGTQGDPAPGGTPWAQQVLDYQAAWRFSEGSGVTVAVIDSGVDASPQLSGRVIVGPTLAAAPAGPAAGDCVGHGTSVAGIIAAAPIPGVSFAGVAPRATILSVKVTNSEADVTASAVEQAIYDAVGDGASVINLSLALPDTPALRDAVTYALDRDVVVVASAGNDTPDSGAGPFYPAAYPGVLSVGAVDSSGTLADFSAVKTPVDVTAPGVDITSTFPGAYLSGQDGTSFATAFVSGIAALVRARYPRLSAAQVVTRIEETADGAAGPGTGNGLVNPVQAVTAVLPARLASARAAAGPGRVAIDRAAPAGGASAAAMAVTAGAFGAAALVVAAGVVIPAGRRRRWRPGRPPPGGSHEPPA